MNTILSVDNISCSVKDKTILSGISFKMDRGEKLGIAGESGSGKSTLAKIIAGTILPDSGNITISTGLSERSFSPVQILFQNNGELIHPFRKTRDLLSEALRIKGINNQAMINSEIRLITSLLRISPDLLNRKGCELSGGEQQRFGLARILSLRPDILIVDEPFSAQDPDSTENLIGVLNETVKEMGLTLICISHDLKSLIRVSDEILVIHNGKLIEKDKTSNLINNPVHPYTRFMLKAAEYDLKLKDFDQPYL